MSDLFPYLFLQRLQKKKKKDQIDGIGSLRGPFFPFFFVFFTTPAFFQMEGAGLESDGRGHLAAFLGRCRARSDKEARCDFLYETKRVRVRSPKLRYL